MPANYPDWDDSATPHTDSRAAVSRYRSVSGVRAIRVRGATYRDSQPIDGVFELVGSQVQQVNGEDRYEVYCAWFGVKPPTTFPRISVRPEVAELLENYTGEVIDNISS